MTELTPPVTRLSFDLDCPKCGGTLHLITTTKPTQPINAVSRAIVACPHCRTTYQIETRMTNVERARQRDAMADASADRWANTDLADLQPRRRGPPACGTANGYSAHRRRNEDPCRDCRRAHNTYVNDHRTRPDKATTP